MCKKTKTKRNRGKHGQCVNKLPKALKINTKTRRKQENMGRVTRKIWGKHKNMEQIRKHENTPPRKHVKHKNTTRNSWGTQENMK